MSASYVMSKRKYVAEFMRSIDEANRLSNGLFSKIVPRSSYKKTFKCSYDKLNKDPFATVYELVKATNSCCLKYVNELNICVALGHIIEKVLKK